jgi:hypothetical protein
MSLVEGFLDGPGEPLHMIFQPILCPLAQAVSSSSHARLTL